MTDRTSHERDKESRTRAARLKRAGDSRLTRWLFACLGRAEPQAFLSLVAKRLRHGSLEIIEPDGRAHRFAGPDSGPQAVLQVHDWRLARRVGLEGGLGLARAYIDGDWDSPDLPALIELATLNRRHWGKAARGHGLVKLAHGWRHRRRVNSRAGSKRNIAFHYDLGNAFYAAWLDPSMTYSAAVYAEGDNSLERAQERKYRRLLDQLDVKPGDHILEIGCGWGGFAELAVRDYGVRVTGITLSGEQLKFARARIAKAGLCNLADFQLIDYRDVKGRFDHVVSIEMFEAVGEAYWPSYFQKLHEVLKPGGRAALQIITIEDAIFDAYRRSADFIQAYIFPGGMLPSPSRLRAHAAQVGLSLMSEKSFGPHYARTLSEWRRRFHQAWEGKHLPQGFDDAFKRVWDYYLAYCEGGFRAGGIDVVQVAYSRD